MRNGSSTFLLPRYLGALFRRRNAEIVETLGLTFPSSSWKLFFQEALSDVGCIFRLGPRFRNMDRRRVGVYLYLGGIELELFLFAKDSRLC